jgi:hypothetical protein
MGGVRRFAEIVPAAFGHFDSVVFGCGFDIGERLFPLLVGDVLDLVETGEGIADMRRVVERFFAFVGECERGGGKFVALICVEGLIVFVMFPGCFHWELQLM